MHFRSFQSMAFCSQCVWIRISTFLPGGLVESCFFVASVLRTIFSALTLPTTEEVSSTVKVRFLEAS